jgi:hypothetical protein
LESKTPYWKTEFIHAVRKLTRLTHEGELIWKVQPVPLYLAKLYDFNVGTVFAGTYGGKNLRLYEVHIRNLAWDSNQAPPIWPTQVVLELVNDEGLCLWTFPDLVALHSLADTVKNKVADVNDLLELLAS